MIFLIVCVNIYGKMNIELTNEDLIHKENNYCTAYFASGCFWCVESIYENFKGVINVTSGYAGGYIKNPTYYQVVNGKTGHAETVKVLYNPNIIKLCTI